jgi:hypothetical protein
MKIGMVIYSSDVETVWDEFRQGVFSLKQGDTCSAFLLAKGVVSESCILTGFLSELKCRPLSMLVASS